MDKAVARKPVTRSQGIDVGRKRQDLNIPLKFSSIIFLPGFRIFYPV